MEFLKKVESKGPLSCDTVLKIFYQTCRAVQHMHRQKPPIIHRDLKVRPRLPPAGCCHLRVRVWTVVGATPAWSREEVTSPGLLWAGGLPACCWAPSGSASCGAAVRLGAHGGCPFPPGAASGGEGASWS